ncbi:MAG: FAD-dependent oxidoreductase, partial [Pseudomonadota bacterium]
DATNYLEFCRQSEAVFNTLNTSFLQNDRPSMLSLARRANPVSLLGTQPFSTLWNMLGKRFEDPRLQQLFGRYATYCGASPFEAPATLMLIAHVEQAGVWTLTGGMHALAKALEDLATGQGAEIRHNTPIIDISLENGRPGSVVLDTGEQVAVDLIVHAADLAALCVEGEDIETSRAAIYDKKGVRSQSAMTWTMSADVSGLDLSVHNVFFSDNYGDEFDAVFNRRTMPDPPTTYVFAPDRTKGGTYGDAPERLFFLINAPPTGDVRQWSREETQACQSKMMNHLAICGADIAVHPETIIATTPTDFANRFPSTGGALYGRAGHGWQATFKRSGVRTKVPGLYLAGGSVHPGPGVPMAALSGRAAANAAIRDFALTA